MDHHDAPRHAAHHPSVANDGVADRTPGAPAEHLHSHAHHPGWKTYVVVGIILTIITAVEVSAYYIPAWENSKIYVPSMLIMSAVKFFIVVMFYMHLKYDHRLFRALFTGPFIVAAVSMIGLMFLFGKMAVRMGILN